MKKLFFTAVAVLAFNGVGFAEGKEVVVKKLPPNCYYGAASAFNMAINLGSEINFAWRIYDASLRGCLGTGFTSSGGGPSGGSN